MLGARWIGLPPSAGGRLRLDTATVSALGHEHGRQVILRWNQPAPPAPGTAPGPMASALIFGGRFSYGVESTTVVRVVTFADVRISCSTRSRSVGLATRTSSR